jgi:hypothetical protein
LQPSTARITEVDINGPARALAVLRWSDYFLVIGGGFGALAMAVQSVIAAGTGDWAGFLMTAVMAAALGFAAYTGWRHVGVIDPRVWGSYLWVFPLLACISAFFAFALAAAWMTEDINPFESDMQSVLAFVLYLQFAAVAIPGFVCVLLLRRMRIAPMNVRIGDLLRSLHDRGGAAAPLTKVPRISTRRGLAYGVGGLVMVLGATFVPVSAEGRQATTVLRGLEQVTILGFFLLLRARRYFQVNADSLLAVDRRSPVLFLRSFGDDERQQYASSRRALLDFSLETRLANHFHRFGPFIAIGSPTETVPQLGAARVLLSDDQWQSRVLDWMKAASVIIMYCGTTQWVNWELRQVIASGRATSLILMFPEIKGWRSSRRRRDIAARTELIRQVFQPTPWSEELMEFSDFAGLRAMLFRGDGSMLMIRSRSRSRDAYHLAALIAHQHLLDPGINATSVATRADRPARRKIKVIAATLAAAAAVFTGLYVMGSSRGTRLVFQQGTLYYDAPVTQAEAQRVGEYLVQQEVFNAQQAATVQLNREQDLYQLRFVVNPAVVDNTLTNIQFGLLGSDIAQNILGGKPLEVALCDPELKPLKVVPPSARLELGQSEIYYTHPVTMDQARALGDQLVETGFFTAARATSVHLSREAGTYQLRFIVDPTRANDREIVAAFGALTGVIADEALGGETVVVHLCDQEFRALNSERVERPTPTGRSGRD